MNFKATYISYQQTGAFSRLVNDYTEGALQLRNFYQHTPDLDGIKNSIASRSTFPLHIRKLLTEVLLNQYETVTTSKVVKDNIIALSEPNTFTICTAHQPNIFTGHLYFIYKILHVIRIADELTKEVPGSRFVPVFYMGSEDADLKELGEISVNDKKYTWNTDQKGAVGYMKIDKPFLNLLSELKAQLIVDNFGHELISSLEKCYTLGTTVEQATFSFINELFADFGLVVLLPGSSILKAEFSEIIQKELTEQFSHNGVEKTLKEFPSDYKVQATGRAINLFYLNNDIRERIEQIPEGFAIANTSMKFSTEEMRKELAEHPERFSPNVVLRPLYQEMILPNIAFVGGGGELAYWLELKKVFDCALIPYPVIILRNSFMIISKKVAHLIKKLGFTSVDFFQPAEVLIRKILKKHSTQQLELFTETEKLRNVYQEIKLIAGNVDHTLQQHVDALCAQALQRISILEKKMLKEEKKKFEAEQRQINKVKDLLFPTRALQERVDNILPYYASWGKTFIPELLAYSPFTKAEFTILEEQ